MRLVYQGHFLKVQLYAMWHLHAELSLLLDTACRG